MNIGEVMVKVVFSATSLHHSLFALSAILALPAQHQDPGNRSQSAHDLPTAHRVSRG